MKTRLDTKLVQMKILSGRDKAKQAILAGEVVVDGVVITKPGCLVDEENEILFTGESPRYVSRGGYKLEKALETFSAHLHEKTCMDIGASTGGFTDCMLQNGAKIVYAIDAGAGQLDEALCRDNKVVNLPKTNFRYYENDALIAKIDFVSIDVSFISLTQILPGVCRYLAEDGSVVALVKPQFEAGKQGVGKNGIVKDDKIHHEVLVKLITFSEGIGLFTAGLTHSPITGSDGNREYLLHLVKKKPANGLDWENTVKEVIKKAKNLNK